MPSLSVIITDSIIIIARLLIKIVIGTEQALINMNQIQKLFLKLRNKELHNFLLTLP
jgi:hypothetical protein